MSRNSIILQADGLKVRCAAHKRYAVAIPAPKRLLVVKRTDDVKALVAELRRINRELPNRHAYVFDLPTGTLVHHHWGSDAAPDEAFITRRISDVMGRG